jgi:hypothetical protein
MLQDEEFIICHNCKNKMIKTPLNVRYDKIGNRFLLKGITPYEKIDYIYCCEHCICAVPESVHNEFQYWKKLREDLIQKGEKYVPNEFGFYHWIGKPDKIETENIPSRRRIFETYKIGRDEFIKIVDKYTDGTEVQIK